jgi:hypothetical protein
MCKSQNINIRIIGKQGKMTFEIVTNSTIILILKWMKSSKKKDYENDELNRRDMKKHLNKYKENADK